MNLKPAEQLCFPLFRKERAVATVLKARLHVVRPVGS